MYSDLFKCDCGGRLSLSEGSCYQYPQNPGNEFPVRMLAVMTHQHSMRISANKFINVIDNENIGKRRLGAKLAGALFNKTCTLSRNRIKISADSTATVHGFQQNCFLRLA